MLIKFSFVLITISFGPWLKSWNDYGLVIPKIKMVFPLLCGIVPVSHEVDDSSKFSQLIIVVSIE